MIITVTLNPSIDHTLFVDRLCLHDANRVTAVEVDAGGKGINASRVIKNLGGETLATGFVGGQSGAFVTQALAREGVPCEFTQIKGDTRLNFSVEDGGGDAPTQFNEPGPEIAHEELDALLDSLDRHLPHAKWLLAAGSTPPCLGAEIFHRLGTLARKHCVPFAADGDGPNLQHALLGGPSFIKPNTNEASRLLGRIVKSLDEVLVAAREIREMLLEGNPAIEPLVIISRGADGAVLADREGLWVGHSPNVVVRSTVGSGDSMVGAFLQSLEIGEAPSRALAFGLAAGAATAGSSGGKLATKQQIASLFEGAKIERA